MAGPRQVISRISKGSQNILIYNFIITTFDCQGRSQGGGISARAFALARYGVTPPQIVFSNFFRDFEPVLFCNGTPRYGLPEPFPSYEK